MFFISSVMGFPIHAGLHSQRTTLVRFPLERFSAPIYGTPKTLPR